MHTSDIHFALADASHDAAIRKLLRECPMEGRIRLSLQREPSYFRAAGIEGPEHHTIIALRGDDIVAMGSVSVRERFYNGRVMRMGYLGGLRLNRSCWGRFDIIRRGYQFLRKLHPSLNVPFYLTSVAADNHRAIGILERGLPDMPTYRHVGDLGTALVRTSRKGISSREPVCDQHEIFSHLEQSMHHFQFAPHWAEEEMKRQLDFQCLRNDHREIIGCAALWDQRSFKQAVVRGYSPSMAAFRPFYNLIARLTGSVVLPQIGDAIPQAFVSHFSLAVGRPELVEELFELLSATAHSMGIELMAFGLDVRDPRLKWIKSRLHARVYHTRLYMVRWTDDPQTVEPPDERLMYPEVALL